MTIFGTSGDDEMNGGAGQDIFDGLGGNDEFRGGRGSDIYYGRDGNDWMYFERGNDTFYGGSGFDRADYRDATGGIVADLKAGTIEDGAGFTDRVFSVERVIGSDFNDRIFGDGKDNSFTTGAGNDTVDGRGGYDFVWYGREAGPVIVKLNKDRAEKTTGTDILKNIEGVSGSNFSDRLIGNGKDNFFVPDQEDDIFTPNYETGGDDFVNGGNGFDGVGYFNAVAGVTVNLATGEATDGRGNTDTLKNIEFVVGSGFGDVLIGDDLHNVLEGGAGDDDIRGLKGDDSLDGGTGADTLGGDAGHDELFGGSGNDQLSGGNGKDDISGGNGHDKIFGGGKGDRLIGGKGDDELTGGGGPDTFVFKGKAGEDVVKDFTVGQDSLDLSAYNLGKPSDVRKLATDVDGGTIIDLTDDGGGTIFLQQISRAALTSDELIL